jgi:hypothetical protein
MHLCVTMGYRDTLCTAHHNLLIHGSLHKFATPKKVKSKYDFNVLLSFSLCIRMSYASASTLVV